VTALEAEQAIRDGTVALVGELSDATALQIIGEDDQSYELVVRHLWS
jgi:hypothetical protein